ncbi:hypothetical protein YO5_12352 [Stutzerimonas stutzeri TS44]|nr:hypothetical protein YO5_12352 [Stutzerimonas stutzeri TS44]
MPRRFFKRYMPHPDRIKTNKSLRFLGALIHDPNLWHLNRHSVSRAMAIGLVWLTNPLTMPPVFYCTYKLGAWLLDAPALSMPEELTLAWVTQLLQNNWQPLYLGSLVAAIGFAVLGYVGTQAYWRWWVGRSWRRRQNGRR